MRFILLFLFPITAVAWQNGQSGNASTNDPSECASPQYSTHDWVADHTWRFCLQTNVHGWNPVRRCTCLAQKPPTTTIYLQNAVRPIPDIMTAGAAIISSEILKRCPVVTIHCPGVLLY